MATIKFKEPSPYAKAAPVPPKEDYLYAKYMEDLALKQTADHPVIKVALFGAGRAGTIHLSNISESSRVKLLYVVDDLESNWPKLKAHWNLDKVVFLNSKQAERVFKDPNVDAVIVSSPTYTHEGIVVKSLQEKKAVFCEKPIAEKRENIANCYEAAKKAGKPLFCAFNRRFDPSYIMVRERVRNGEVGHVNIMKCVARDSPLPSLEYLKSSGGIFKDCMVHDFDLTTWMLGEYPTKVSCTASALIPEIKGINDYDTVVATLHFPSGTIGVCDNSRNSPYGYDQRIEVFGPKGCLTAENEQPVHCITFKDGLKGIQAPPIWYSFASRFRLAYLKEFNHFLDVVTGKAEMCITQKEVLANNKIAAAVEESARTGKMVEISWAPGEI